MESIVKHYIVDLSSNNNFIQIPTVQGDGNGVRIVELELIQNGTTYVIDSTVTGAIMGTKPDTKQVCNQIEITPEGYIRFDITSQMAAVKGRGDYQVVLFDVNKNSQLKSFPFIIITTEAAFDVDYLVSSDDFQLLTNTLAKALTDYTYVMEHAQASADSAESSANNANTYANTAKGYRDTAKTYQDNAKTYQDNASASATKSETEANKSLGYANDSKTYSLSSEGYKNQSSDFADMSKSYAVGTNGTVREGDALDNAKYYYEKSEEIAQGLMGALLPQGTYTFEEVMKLTGVKSGYMYNIKNNFTTTSAFREGAGISMPAGTNIYYTSDSKWDCLAGTNVIGVKGQAESSYRTGNVNITRANIGQYTVTSATEPTDQYVGEFWNQEY